MCVCGGGGGGLHAYVGGWVRLCVLEYVLLDLFGIKMSLVCYQQQCVDEAKRLLVQFRGAYRGIQPYQDLGLDPSLKTTSC